MSESEHPRPPKDHSMSDRQKAEEGIKPFSKLFNNKIDSHLQSEADKAFEKEANLKFLKSVDPNLEDLETMSALEIRELAKRYKQGIDKKKDKTQESQASAEGKSDESKDTETKPAKSPKHAEMMEFLGSLPYMHKDVLAKYGLMSEKDLEKIYNLAQKTLASTGYVKKPVNPDSPEELARLARLHETDKRKVMLEALRAIPGQSQAEIRGYNKMTTQELSYFYERIPKWQKTEPTPTPNPELNNGPQAEDPADAKTGSAEVKTVDPREQDFIDRGTYLNFLRSQEGLTQKKRSEYNRMTTEQLKRAYSTARGEFVEPEKPPQKAEPTAKNEKPKRIENLGVLNNPKLSWESAKSATLKAMMKEMMAEEAADWAKVGESEQALAKQYGINVVRGDGKQNTNLEAHQKLNEVLSLLPNDTYKGKYFHPNSNLSPDNPVAVRPDGIIEFNPNANTQDLHDFYAEQIMGLKRAGPDTKNVADAKHEKNVRAILERVEQEGVPPFARVELLEALQYKGVPLTELSKKTPQEMIEMLKRMQPPGAEAAALEIITPEPAPTEVAVTPPAPETPPISDTEISAVLTPEPISPVVPVATVAAASAAEIPAPAAPEVAPVAPHTPEQIRQRLDAARARYVQASADLNKYHGLRVLRDKILGRDGHERVGAAFADAQAEYKLARAEFISSQSANYLAEQKLLNQAKYERYGYGRAPRSWMEALHKIGDLNLLDYVKKMNPDFSVGRIDGFLLKNINVRKLVYAGLLGSGLYVGAGAGAGLITLARGYSAFGTAVGSRGLLEMGRKKLFHEKLSEAQINAITSLNEVTEHLSHLQTREFFAGKSSAELEALPVYQQLTAKQNQLIAALDSDPNAAQKFEDQFNASEVNFDLQYKKERTGRRSTAIAGAGIAAATTLGFSGMLMNKATKAVSSYVDIDLAKENSGTVGSKARSIVKGVVNKLTGEVERVQSPVAGKIEITSRGIEGTLSDLKTANPDAYGKMVKWLHEQYPDSKAKESSLIHRMVTKIADQNGYTVGKGGLDLNKIQSGGIVLHEDGSFSLGKDQISFMKESAQAAVESADSAVDPDANQAFDMGSEEVPPTDGPESTDAPTDASAENFLANAEEGGGFNADSDAPTQETAVNSLEEMDKMFEKTMESTARHTKLSDALHEVAKNDYNKLIKDYLMIDARELNKIQNQSVGEMIKLYNHSEISPAQRKEYSGIFSAILSYIQEHPDTASKIKGESLRSFLLRVALERVNK